MYDKEYFCPQCGSRIPSNDVNAVKNTALCRTCGLFLFSTEVLEEAGDREGLPDIPQYLKVEETAGSVRLIYRKRILSFILFFAVFALGWNGIIMTVVTDKIMEMWKVRNGVESFQFDYFILFFVPFVLAGLILIAAVFIFLFAKAVFVVRNKKCEFFWGVGPWGKQTDFNLEKGSTVAFRRRDDTDCAEAKEIVVISPEGKEVFSTKGVIEDKKVLNYIRVFFKEMCR